MALVHVTGSKSEKLDSAVIRKSMEGPSLQRKPPSSSRHANSSQLSYNTNKTLQIFLALQVFYFSSSLAFKTSLILLYYRIFGVIRWFRWTLAAAWTIVLLYFIVDLIVAIFECTPVAYYWDKTIKGGTCINQDQFYRWNGVANLLIDFMILTLSIPMIWRLNLAYRQKLSLSGIFLLGLL